MFVIKINSKFLVTGLCDGEGLRYNLKFLNFIQFIMWLKDMGFKTGQGKAMVREFTVFVV